MVRFLPLLFLVTLSFCADLGSNLKSIVGDQIYQKNSAKISSLFANEPSFVDINGNLNYDKIATTLRTNSLLNLNYSSPTHMQVTFRTSSSPMLFLKVISQSLNNLGYTYFLTKNFQTMDSGISWTVSINTQFLLNPGNLYNELMGNNTFIKDIQRTGQFSFIYDIDMSKTVLDTAAYESDANVELSKPLEPYFFNINGKKSIEITADSSDNWIALVKVFDRNLKLISQLKSDKKEKVIDIEFPSDAYYILIDDAYSLENIKHGLKIYIKSN
ncbi:hypothetical protein CIG2463D_0308 [Campylobacter iguaniorum]|uniref:Periplasmic protein n=1 Tax=Campylobacter iguaniorum TaxID=1244531 RepID=A0A076FE98_9BACT|nr:hypothetical protein [Campylobacter iguaniorum]AII14174.1 hypothetical protein CIG1485E_0303 [Campylobacter iguaniorum]ALV23913.1 hypothetical protein CIG2463D_0308 [Campylobacter iguaniorum]